jgi:hypothetical protein
MTRTVLIISLLLTSTIARGAGFNSGNELLALCNERVGSIDFANCSGNIVGYADMMSLLGLVCFDKEVTKGQVRDLVKKSLQDNPATRNKSSVSLAYVALSDAFPCKN